MTTEVEEIEANRKGQSTRASLEEAVRHAIGESVRTAAQLQMRIEEAVRELEQVTARAAESAGDDEKALNVLDGFRRELSLTQEETSDLFERQCQALQTVNIALFGRTGAGKSTFIEALTHGDGATVSPSESDFTVEVRDVNWRGCRVFDTPGINGWGRSVSRAELERRARKAVEIADIVVLCFDTQSQQKGEFDKVGAWVKEYGKPVIAILNNKNQVWRRPDRVPLASQRRRLSRAVREHVNNIETELAALGIFGVPVIAISAQRAMYARVKGEYLGPAPRQMEVLRRDLGVEPLFETSNFGVLEALLVDALTSHATELRLGMLNAQSASMLGRLTESLDLATNNARIAGETIDDAIESIFSIVGYPALSGEARQSLPMRDTGEDLLTWAERLRGGPFEAKNEGKMGRFSKQRLGVSLGALRARSLSKAEDTISERFEERKDLDPEEFFRIVFDQKAIMRACERIEAEIVEFVRRETQLVLKTAKLDLELVETTGPPVDVSAGSMRRLVGYGAGAATVGLSGLSTWLGKLALGAAATPGGQPAAVAFGLASIGAGIAAAITGIFGKKQRRKAEEIRHKAWAEAVASARRQVNAVYDALTEDVTEMAVSMARKAMVQLVAEPLSRVGGLWSFVGEASIAVENLKEIHNGLPSSSASHQALMVSAVTISAQSHPGDPAGYVKTFLGEAWVADPMGLTADEGDDRPSQTHAYDPTTIERLFQGLNSFVERFGANVERGSGLRWLEGAESILATDAKAKPALEELRKIADSGRARFCVFGDYSSGKTSFIKRLLIDDGLPIPVHLEVRADPTTDSVHLYEWGDIDLVDVPGLQSTDESHDRIASEAFPDASAIICLLQPNLLVGSTVALEKTLKGDDALGLAPKLDRTIFVIHRSDELGADPEIEPDEYIRICDRKKKELVHALASRRIVVDEDRIICMAADPYQLVGSRRDVNSQQFDRFRSWDGFAEFRKSIRNINAKFKGTGVDRSLLEGGLARLGKLRRSAYANRRELDSRLEAISRLQIAVAEVCAEGERIECELHSKARRIVDDRAFGCLERVVGAASTVELNATAEQLSKWWETPDFEEEVSRWQSDAKETLDAWFERSADQLDRALNSPRFKAAFARSSTGFDLADLSAESNSWVSKLLRFTSKPLKGANRDVVYFVGKALGHNFKPWGAVNLARVLGRVGVVLGIFVTVMDAIELYRSWKGEKRRAALRKELRGIVEKSASEVLRELVDGRGEVKGPMAYLRVMKEHLEAIGVDLKFKRKELESEISSCDSQRAAYSETMEQAWELLGYRGNGR